MILTEAKRPLKDDGVQSKNEESTHHAGTHWARENGFHILYLTSYVELQSLDNLNFLCTN